MKKILPLFLLCIFLFNTVGYYIVFKVALIEARKEIKFKIKQGLPMNELTAISIDKKAIENIHWIKKNKEFYYENKLYDVVKMRSSISSITFYCISDEKEHALFSNLDEHINLFVSEDNRNSSDAKKLSEHVFKIFFYHTINFYFINKGSRYNFYSFTTNYQSELPQIKSPPPELV